MDAKKRRQLYKEQTADRQKENYANKDNSGRFGGIFEESKRAGVQFFKCKEDDHEIFIVPYIVGEQHPRLKAGKVDFLLDVFVHRKVGINEDSVICLNRTYKEPCPICEYQAQLKAADDPDEALIKSLNPTRRNIFNIVCCDSQKEIDKGIQVWDVSQWLFTNPLEELAHKKKGGGEVMYADIDEGKIISFRKKGSGVTSTEYTAFEFKDRDEIPDEILEAAHCLDELIHKPEYDEVATLFFGNEEKEEKPPVKAKEKAKEKEEEEEKPPVKKTLSKKEEPKDVPDPGAEEVTECPGGAAFGTDYNEYDECGECDVRKQCAAKKDELEAPPPAKKKLTRRG
jgi:hypothetical protein